MAPGGGVVELTNLRYNAAATFGVVPGVEA